MSLASKVMPCILKYALHQKVCLDRRTIANSANMPWICRDQRARILEVQLVDCRRREIFFLRRIGTQRQSAARRGMETSSRSNTWASLSDCVDYGIGTTSTNSVQLFRPPPPPPYWHCQHSLPKCSFTLYQCGHHLWMFTAA